jgi:predicted nuclease of predicted toxin-antitoxin system
MAAIKIYLDEDVHTFIAQALKLRGWGALTTEDAQRRGADDLDQISFATNNRYAILTYNVKDFPRLHYEIVTRGDTHSGIIVGTRENPRRNVHALLNILSSLSAESLKDQLVFLNNWS